MTKQEILIQGARVLQLALNAGMDAGEIMAGLVTATASLAVHSDVALSDLLQAVMSSFAMMAAEPRPTPRGMVS